MAIIINSLSPAPSPISVLNNSPVQFNCSITESGFSSGFIITGVQWQVSINGGTTWNNAPFLSSSLTDIGLGDYSSAYNTGNLNASNQGDLYRIEITSSSGEIVTSDVYSGIGVREINIVQNPQIVVLNEDYDPFYIVPDNGTVVLNASATYFNRPVALPSDLDNLIITWQKSYNYDPDDPNNPSTVWTNVTAGTVVNEANYAIVNSTFIYNITSGSYGKNSQLTISSIKFGLNDVYFRPVYSSSGVNNSPLISNYLTYILVNPTISIITQPGVATNNTKDTMFCYGAGNPSNGVFTSDPGGDFRSSISAVTSASSSSTLVYEWQFRCFNDGFSGNLNDNLSNALSLDPWDPIQSGQTAGLFIIDSNDDELVLRRLQYRDRYQFRCILNGTIGEPSVQSNIHEIYIRDNITNLSSISSPIVTLEDFYGNVVNRNLLTDKPIRNVSISSLLNIANYLGQEGNIEFQWERKDPGSSVWNSVGNPEYISYVRSVGNASSPATTNEEYISTYITPPLRINDGVGNQRDDGAEYRLRARSSAVYTFNSSASYPLKKTLTSWYSNAAILDVFKEIFITAQPTNISVFPTQIASFSANFTITSGLSTVNYKWQRANSVGNLPNLNTIVDISNGPLFGVSGEDVVSGATGTGVSSATLIISNATSDLTQYFFRVIISDPNALNSVTSDFARAIVSEDKFNQISSINDYFIDEFETVSWTVNASTLSQGAITYQWQKSTNFGQSQTTVVWNDLINSSNIQGVTTNTLTISDAQNPQDVGYYRLKLISSGGTIAYSNVVRLAISVVEINITQNLPTTLTFIEGETISTPFEIEAFSSNGEQISYRWEYKKIGDTQFSPFGPGVDFQSDTSNPYIPNPFFKQDNWDGAEVRVRMSIPSFLSGSYVYSNVSVLDIKRRFYYFADSAIKTIPTGSAFSVNLGPNYTGNEVPTFQWEYSTNSGSSWSSVSNIGAVGNQDTLFVPTVNLTNDGYLFRCLVTLTSVDQFLYTRNNTQIIQNVSGFGYTANIELNVISAELFPIYLSQEIGKTGAAVGTVICIPKPAGYLDQTQTATTDDINQWEVSLTGDPFQTGNTTSQVTSGAIFDQNKAYLNRGSNWIDSASYTKSPKWLISKDRFPGFIELRGQWILKSEFPLLYEIIGDRYGSTPTLFKLPNPYGKKIMGTGAVNSQTGRTSVVPLYNASGESGGDRLEPGTVGGVWNYERSRQLPPGSPNISGEPDGTAGLTDPNTFTLGNYSTTGWTDSQAIASTSFSGSFTYEVGPLGESFLATPPPHIHRGVSIRGSNNRRAARECAFHNPLEPEFNEINEAGGQINSGPTYIADADRGRVHTHGISDTYISSGVNATANHGAGIGDTTAGQSWSEIVNIDFRASAPDSKSINSFLEPVDVVMSNASKTAFDNNLSFYIRNAESIPIISNYFRVKWMIKAY